VGGQRPATTILLVATLVCGCGSAGSGATAGPPRTTATPFSGRAGAARFLGLVNSVCRTVRAGAPPALAAGAGDQTIRAHAERGAAAAQRTLTAFGRLNAPTTALAKLRLLNAAYVELAALYRTVLRPGGPPPHAFLAAIRLQENRTSLAAVAAGLAPCGPQTANRR
jgi:hypothetical protein